MLNSNKYVSGTLKMSSPECILYGCRENKPVRNCAMQLLYSFDRRKKGLESEVIHTYVSQRKHVSGLKHMVNRKAAVSSPTFLCVA